MESCIKELLSFTAEVRGIKFYPGYEDFRLNADARGGFLYVDLRREADDNTHDKNAVLIVTRCRTPRVLGHLERRVAAASSHTFFFFFFFFTTLPGSGFTCSCTTTRSIASCLCFAQSGIIQIEICIIPGQPAYYYNSRTQLHAYSH